MSIRIADPEVSEHRAFKIFHALCGWIGVVSESYQMEHAMDREMRKVMAEGQTAFPRFALRGFESDGNVPEFRVRVVR